MAGIFYRQASPFDDNYRQELISSILTSEHFGPSVLGAEFVDTTGLSLVFRREYVVAVASNFPLLSPILELAMFDTSNAFYVNPLVLDKRSSVGEHIDCRFIASSGVRVLPTVVSVYYAEIDETMSGGDLVFVTDDGEVAVRPRANEVVHFIGTARHYVSQIESNHRRVSVVIEQYNLDDISLLAFPECHLVQAHPSQVVPSRH